MKKSTELKALAEEVIFCINDNHLSEYEAIDYLTDILCEKFCTSTNDYTKNTKCDHGTELRNECSECSKS